MTEEARRQPKAARQPQRCVYLQSYSWGKSKEQQSSNRATESLFLVLFAVGSFKTPSRLTGNKEQQHEERNGTDPEEKEQTGKHIIMESDTAIIIITLFYLLQLGEVNIEFLEEITKEVLHFF